MSNIFFNIWIACVKVLFTFLHVVYSGFQYFDLTWTLFKRKYDAAFSNHGLDSGVHVARFVTKLDSCPSHLAVIVGDDAIGCQDFTNLIIWCLAAGISFLTVYDQKGVVKDQEIKLYKFFTENTNMKESKVVFRNLPAKNGEGKNGYRNKILVSILSCSDGKEAFVEMVQDLATRIRQGDITSASLHQDLISCELSARSHCPDPDLVIIGGPVLSTFGYPPWNLRLTEFIKVPSLEGINEREFCDVLKRYAACEKRIGK